MSEKQQYRLSLSRIIGTAGVCSLLTLAIVMGGSAGFVSLPSALLTFGLCFFLLLISYGKDYLRFIPASFACLVSTPQQSNARYADIAASGSRFVIGGSVVAALIGTIQMLRNLSDPSTIGAGLAVALISPFYALLASEMFFAIVHNAFASSGHERTSQLPARNIGLLIAVVGYIMGTFLIMLNAFSNMHAAVLIETVYGQQQSIQRKHNHASEAIGASLNPYGRAFS